MFGLSSLSVIDDNNSPLSEHGAFFITTATCKMMSGSSPCRDSCIDELSYLLNSVCSNCCCSVSMDMFCDYFVVTLLCCASSLVFSSDVLHVVMYGACALLICWRWIQLFAVIFFLAPGASPLIPTQWPLMLTMFNCIKKCHLSMSLDADVWLC